MVQNTRRIPQNPEELVFSRVIIFRGEGGQESKHAPHPADPSTEATFEYLNRYEIQFFLAIIACLL